MVILRPSKAHQWIACAASPLMQEQSPDIFGVSEADEEGIAAHYVAAQLLNDHMIGVGDITPNDMVVTNDMLDSAIEYCSIVKNWGIKLDVETLIDIPILDMDGTPDCVGVDFDNKLIHIIDFKYGFDMIEPYKNWQLLCYLSGVISKINDESQKSWSAELSIYQPRMAHHEGQLRTWILPISAFLSKYLPILIDFSEKARSLTPVTTVGSQCRYCSARYACPTLQISSYIAVDISRQSSPNFELDIASAGQELSQIDHAIDRLKYRKTGLEAQLSHKLGQGESSKFYTLQRVKSREKWQSDKEQSVINMGKLLGKDFAMPNKALSPSQCRKLGLDEDIIKSYSYTPIGDNKLVRLTTTESQKLFGD